MEIENKGRKKRNEITKRKYKKNHKKVKEGENKEEQKKTQLERAIVSSRLIKLTHILYGTAT